MRDVNRYDVVNNVLRWDLWERKNPERPPFARPIIDSGEAFKKVYLSKAPVDFDSEKLAKALEHHVRKMQAELARDGKLVTSITKTLDGKEGDVRVICRWVVLGQKRNKHWRRRNAVQKPGAEASGAAETQGSESGEVQRGQSHQGTAL